MKSLRSCIWGLIGMLMTVQVFGQGRIQFEKSSHNFGTVKEEEGPVEVIFPFVNRGKSAFVIERVQASCGCTTPEWSKDSVPPGSKGFIKVKYNPLNRPGSFKKQIFVKSTASPANTTLAIYGRVLPRPKGPRDFYPFDDGNLRFKTNHLTFSTIYKDQEKTERTVMYNQGDRPIRFNRARSIVPPHLRPRMSRGVLAPGDTMHLIISYLAERQPDWGFVFDNLFLATDDPDKPMKRINISADVRERFPTGRSARAALANLVLDKAQHDFGKVVAGDLPTTTFELRNTGRSPLLLRKVSTPCSCLEVKTSRDSIPPGESAQLQVTFNTRGRVGQEEKEIILIANDPDQPQRSLLIRAKIARRED